ncbi:hypothetical protein D9619_009504 [Psilocybe cf. subviscida]|uniref:Uncharacterized protein n=1 Tax=Psilocybe cf. subviscida TaxID=2480587 RepID=A0A8H5FAH6_9AGAR|nr:hypothetical protein D9619_009504 [Psilocybe cf. subviscida]
MIDTAFSSSSITSLRSSQMNASYPVSRSPSRPSTIQSVPSNPPPFTFRSVHNSTCPLLLPVVLPLPLGAGLARRAAAALSVFASVSAALSISPGASTTSASSYTGT